MLLKKSSSRATEKVSWVDVITIDCEDLKFLDAWYRENTIVRSRKENYVGRSSYWPSEKFGSTKASQRQILMDFVGDYKKRRRY